MPHNTTSETKFKKVMHEYSQGKLKSHGTPVTDQKQAIAIAFSEARKVNPNYKEGSRVRADKSHIENVIANHKETIADYEAQLKVARDEKKEDSVIRNIRKNIDIHRELLANAEKRARFSGWSGKTGEDFELGTPVVWGNESGAVISRDGKIGISLYKDKNYSGPEERIVFPKLQDWNNIKTFAEANMKEGGPIKNQYAGKTPEQVWNGWKPWQRRHFIVDHVVLKPFMKKENDVADKKWSELPDNVDGIFIKGVISNHVETGQYTEGGKVIQSDIVTGAKFKNPSGSVFIIDKVYKDKIFGTAVESSLEGGEKGNYRDSIEEMVSFFNEEGAKKISKSKKMDDGGKLPLSKKQLQERIIKLKKSLAGIKSPGVRDAMHRRINKLQQKFDYNPSIREKIAAQKGTFYLDVPTEYAKPIYRKLWSMGIKPKLHKLDGNTKVVVDHTRKLEKAYTIYSDLLAEKGKMVPALSKIKGKL